MPVRYFSAIIRAAARDSTLPSGKSPGFSSATGSGCCFSVLFIVFRIFIASLCNAYHLREPVRKLRVFRVGFEFVARHAVEKLTEIDVFRAVNPLPLRVDLRARLNCSDYRRRSNFHISGPFNDAL
jgi:hypothetical protein